MKVTVKNSPNGTNVKFPCLMVSDKGNIVLMCATGFGVTLKHDTYGFGHHSDDWDMLKFTPFNGTVELRND